MEYLLLTTSEQKRSHNDSELWWSAVGKGCGVEKGRGNQGAVPNLHRDQTIDFLQAVIPSTA